MDYRKLEGKIKEVYDTQGAFSTAMDFTNQNQLSQRLNGKVEWKTAEMIKACELLNIPLCELHRYFFKAKV